MEKEILHFLYVLSKVIIHEKPSLSACDWWFILSSRPAWKWSRLQKGPLSAVFVNFINSLHRVAILLTTRFCICLLLCAVSVAESLPLARAGQMLDLPFGCSFQLRCLLFALTLMHIRQQNARVLLPQLRLTFGCSYLVSSWPTLGTCACSGKDGNFFPPASLMSIKMIHSPSLSSYLKRNLNFSPSKFCDVCQSLLQVLYLVYLTVAWRSSPKGASLMMSTSTNVKCETVAFTDSWTIYDFTLFVCYLFFKKIKFTLNNQRALKIGFFLFLPI